MAKANYMTREGGKRRREVGYVAWLGLGQAVSHRLLVSCSTLKSSATAQFARERLSSPAAQP